MEHFLTTAPGIIISVGSILAVVAVGVLYFLGLLKGKKDNADDRLIDILKTTVEELEKKVDKQRTDIDELTTEVEELRRDNKRYIEILQGRDEATKEFYKQALESMQVSKATHEIVISLAESMKSMAETLAKHTTAVETQK